MTKEEAIKKSGVTEVLAYRKRTKLIQGGSAKSCHIVVSPIGPVFIFEDGTIVKKTEFDNNSDWFYPIVESNA